jgi:hypothetical protein
MSAMFDLFDTPTVPGLTTRDDFLSVGEDASLIAQIDATSLSPFKFQQWTGKRLTRSYGWSYDFESGRFAPTDPFPDWLEPVKVRAARLAGLDPDDLVQALLIRYDPGAGIGWHKDRPAFEHVIGLSLGNPADNDIGSSLFDPVAQMISVIALVSEDGRHREAVSDLIATKRQLSDKPGLTSSRDLTGHAYQRLECSRWISSAGVVEAQRRKRRGPIFQNANEPPCLDVFAYIGLHKVTDADIVQHCDAREAGLIKCNRAVHVDLDRLPALLELPAVKRAVREPDAKARMAEQVGRDARLFIRLEVSR